MFGEKTFPGVGYPTPTDIPETTTCLTLQIPASAEWWAVTVGLLYWLTLDWNWQQFEGGLSRDDAVARYVQMLDDALAVAAAANTCDLISVPAPYWDEDSDVDDSLPVSEQVWYGKVLDPIAPPGELDFIEDITLWTFTGFVAFAAGVDAAIYFKTNVGRFYLTIRDTDIVQLIRIVVDAVDMATVTTPGANSGEINVPIIADPAVVTGHEIYIMQAG